MFIGFLTIVMATSAFAQSSGTIAGTVKTHRCGIARRSSDCDECGNGTDRSVVTSERGDYVIRSCQWGSMR